MRYVDGPIDINPESEIISCNLGTTFGDEDRAEQTMSGGPCHHYGVGAPLKQINTRARGQPEENCQKMPTVEIDQAKLSLVRDMGEET